MATAATHAADAAVNGHQHHPAERGAAAGLNGHASEAAAAQGGKASQVQKRNAQVLRQRKASGKQQQQQQGKHQRPPLGPRSNSAAAPAGAGPQQHKRGMQAAAASGPKLAAARGPGAAAGGAASGVNAAGAGAGASPLQQRLGWLQDFFRQLFSGYGFITMELLRFVLGGLLPRRASLEQAPTGGTGRQQQQQQQQQRRQQQPWPPAGSSGNSTLSALASAQGSPQLLAAAGLPPYLDLQVSGSSHRASVADSLTDSSHPGSCRSECNMPWTPHPHLQQLYIQQQQQQGLASLQFQQQQQQQQPQPSRQNRLSSSSSSPSLHTAATAASWQPSPRALGNSGVVDGGLERHATVPAAAVEAGNLSLSGWSALQQQQQGHILSRSDSTASCVTSQPVASSAAGSIFPSSQVPDSMQGAFSTAPFPQRHQQQYGMARASVPLPAAGAAHSLPSPLATPLAATPLPAHAASLGGPWGCAPDQGAYNGSCGSCWEGLGAGRSPPSSTAGGAGAGSSPSAVLFKGLLRGIVLYEGYRFVRVSVCGVFGGVALADGAACGVPCMYGMGCVCSCVDRGEGKGRAALKSAVLRPASPAALQCLLACTRSLHASVYVKCVCVCVCEKASTHCMRVCV